MHGWGGSPSQAPAGNDGSEHGFFINAETVTIGILDLEMTMPISRSAQMTSDGCTGRVTASIQRFGFRYLKKGGTGMGVALLGQTQLPIAVREQRTPLGRQKLGQFKA